MNTLNNETALQREIAKTNCQLVIVISKVQIYLANMSARLADGETWENAQDEERVEAAGYDIATTVGEELCDNVKAVQEAMFEGDVGVAY